MNRKGYIAFCVFLSMCNMFDFGYVIAYPDTAQFEFYTFINQSYRHRHGGAGGFTLTGTNLVWEWSALVNAYILGFVGGCLVMSWSCERFGRVGSLILASAISAVGNWLNVLAIPFEMPEMIGVGRAIVGVGNGVLAGALGLFLQETSPTSIRGLVSSLQELMLILPSIIGMTLGTRNVLGLNLPMLLAIGAMVDLMVIIALLFVPDTPKHILLTTNNEQKALESLKFYHGDEADGEKFLYWMRQENSNSNNASEHSISIKEICRTKHLRKGALIGGAAFVTQQTSGIFTIFLFATDYFTHVGLSIETAQIGAILMTIVNLTATFVSIFLVDRVGRRPLLLFTNLGVCAALLVYMAFALAFNHFRSVWLGYGCLLTVFGFVTLFSFGPGPVPWFLTAELLPQNVRSQIVGYNLAVSYAVALLITFVSLPLYNLIGVFSYVPLFIVPTLILNFYMYRTLPETKNREISEIIDELSR